MNEILTYLERLRELALDQHGFVTAKQASKIGVPKAELPKMAMRGRIEHVAHGVYRIPQVPATPYDLWALAVLWTGDEQACLSHETALAAWNISDINPEQIHITVSTGRRLRKSGGTNYIVHHLDIEAKRRTWFNEIPITDVPTTIAHCIDWGVPTYLIRQAIERASKTSLLLPKEAKHLIYQLEQRDGY